MLKTVTKTQMFLFYDWSNNHSIYFTNTQVIDKGDYQVQKTLKSWHTAISNKADNNNNKKVNSKPLPRQYSILLK